MVTTATTRLEILQIYKLLHSVRHDNRTEIESLIENGIPSLINYREPQDGDSALHLAAVDDKSELVNYLISIKAFPDVQDFKGRTPLMIAAKCGHHKTVEMLAKNRADMLLRDVDGNDVITYCLTSPTRRHRRCLDIVLSHGADANTTSQSFHPSLVIACEKSIEGQDMCLMLLEKGADPNVIEKDGGRSALSVACLSGSEIVVRALLQSGANPNLGDFRQKTPLHHSAKSGNLKAIQALCAYGVNPLSTDNYGNSALHYAVEGAFPAICKFLAQRGANPLEKNNKGQTARAVAKEKGAKKALIKVLRRAEKMQKRRIEDDPQLSQIKLYDWVFEHQEQLVSRLLEKFQMIDLSTLEGSQIKKGRLVARADMEELLVAMQAPLPKQHKKKIFELHDKERRDVIDIDEFISGKRYVTKQALMTSYGGKKRKKGKKGKKGGRGRGKGTTKVAMPICVDNDPPRRPDGDPPFRFVEQQFLHTDTTRFSRDHKPKHAFEDDSNWYLQKAEKRFISITEAAKTGDVITVREAIQNGTHVDTRDKYYKTALMAACSQGNISMVNFLLSKG